MSEPMSGWSVGADGRRYPVGGPEREDPSAPVLLAELAELINSGDVAREIDRLVDDPDLTA
jgi:hypothetical protein